MVQEQLGLHYPYQLSDLDLGTGAQRGTFTDSRGNILVFHHRSGGLTGSGAGAERGAPGQGEMVLTLGPRTLGWQRPVVNSEPEYQAFLRLLQLYVDDHLPRTEQDSLSTLWHELPREDPRWPGLMHLLSFQEQYPEYRALGLKLSLERNQEPHNRPLQLPGAARNGSR